MGRKTVSVDATCTSNRRHALEKLADQPTTSGWPAQYKVFQKYFFLTRFLCRPDETKDNGGNT